LLGAIGGLYLAHRHDVSTREQDLARARTRQWVEIYLSVRSGFAFDQPPLLKLQEAIERESIKRHGQTLVERLVGVPGLKIRDDLITLRHKLRWELIPEVAAAKDWHIHNTLRRLDAALDETPDESRDEDRLLPTLHLLIVALDLAPAATDEAPSEYSEQPTSSGQGDGTDP
jgi:hypothetical protein